MPPIESMGTVLSTDILIIGAGMAGLAAAISAKEASPRVNVLVVDKAVCGWGGKANKGGGNISYVDPADGIQPFVEYHVRNMGCFLEDQELLAAYASESRGNLELLESWGVHIFRDARREPKYIRWTEGLPWRMAVMDQDMTINMLRHALKLGVRFMDHMAMVDLLKNGGQVVGAVGFSVIEGTCIVAKAKQTILANGCQNYRLMRRWASGRGDGIAAAYRAGAAMRNAEFGNFINWVFTDTKEVCQGAEDVLYNAKGQNISKAVRPVIEADVHSKEVAAWWREIKAGNGPICANMAENFINNVTSQAFHTDALAVRPISTAFWSRTIGKAMAAAKNKGPMQEVMPGFIGEQGCIKVDHRMATTLPGLLAIGDTSFTGSSWAGAVPAPPGRMRGSGLGNAVFSGVRGGRAAAEKVAGIASPSVDAAQVAEIKAIIFAPMTRADGIPAATLVREIQSVMAPVGYSICKRQDRMEEALKRVQQIKNKLPDLGAADWHYLSACHEVRAMAICAELFYRTSLERKESRGWHIREDYPETDNSLFLKWVDVTESNGRMTITTENVPIEKYPVRP
jgi:succinate dehydrogenase / fumarate reductase, flavoprotein subunit